MNYCSSLDYTLYSLGKGEVESSILSCSTINPKGFQAVAFSLIGGNGMSILQNDARTCADEWQDSGTFLYRVFDGDGGLLYIGIANDMARRFGQHCGSWWFDDMAAILAEWFPSRRLAELAEDWAIWLEGPAFNSRRLHPQGERLHREIAEYLTGTDGELLGRRSWVAMTSLVPTEFSPSSPPAGTEEPPPPRFALNYGLWSKRAPKKPSRQHERLFETWQNNMARQVAEKMRAHTEANK